MIRISVTWYKALPWDCCDENGGDQVPVPKYWRCREHGGQQKVGYLDRFLGTDKAADVSAGRSKSAFSRGWCCSRACVVIRVLDQCSSERHYHSLGRKTYGRKPPFDSTSLPIAVRFETRGASMSSTVFLRQILKRLAGLVEMPMPETLTVAVDCN